MPMRARGTLAIDGLLALMVLIWGVNFSVLKRAFQEIPAQPFNALRLIIASSAFLAAILMAQRHVSGGRTVSPVFATPSPVTRADWLHLAWLGVVGHFFYQIGFVGGVALTSVSNAALIIGATPVAVTLLSAALGREQIGRLHWGGALLSLVGIYIVVGFRHEFSTATLRGDLLVMFSVCCWSTYTVGASRLMARHSPLFVTGITMCLGVIPYLVWAAPATLAHDWAHVSAWTWWALVFSALLALNVCYLIWYTAVRAIGASRTAMFSNLVPVAAMIVAAIWLREPMSATKILGAAAVVTGVFLTRLGRKPLPVPTEK